MYAAKTCDSVQLSKCCSCWYILLLLLSAVALRKLELPLRFNFVSSVLHVKAVKALGGVHTIKLQAPAARRTHLFFIKSMFNFIHVVFGAFDAYQRGHASTAVPAYSHTNTWLPLEQTRDAPMVNVSFANMRFGSWQNIAFAMEPLLIM